MRVLVCDDDAIHQGVVQGLLVGWGHEVVVADDGEAARQRVARGGFDIAVIAWSTPGASGLDLCRALRARGDAREPYAVLLVPRAHLDDLMLGLDAGADTYLTKPYRPAELAARLRAAERWLALQDALVAARADATPATERSGVFVVAEAEAEAEAAPDLEANDDSLARAA